MRDGVAGDRSFDFSGLRRRVRATGQRLRAGDLYHNVFASFYSRSHGGGHHLVPVFLRDLGLQRHPRTQKDRRQNGVAHAGGGGGDHPIAVWFSAKVTTGLFGLLLGIVLILLSLYFLFFDKRINIRPTMPNGIFSGALGGTLGGLFSTGGPPAVLYLTHATPDNATYFATIQFYFAVTNVYSTVHRAVNGFITREVLVLAAIGLIGCILGNLVGKLVFDPLDAKKLKLIIYLGMIVSGLLMVI